jgi:hypothetical protein
MWRYRNITTQTTVFISPAPVDLIAIVVNTAAVAAVVTVSDGATATNATTIATIDASATGNFFYNCACLNGLTVALSGGSANVTVVYDGYYDGPQGANE